MKSKYVTIINIAKISNSDLLRLINDLNPNIPLYILDSQGSNNNPNNNMEVVSNKLNN